MSFYLYYGVRMVKEKNRAELFQNHINQEMTFS